MLNVYYLDGFMFMTEKKNHCVFPAEFLSISITKSYSQSDSLNAANRFPD